MEEIRVKRDELPAEIVKINRRGLNVKLLVADGDDWVVTVEPRMEVRVEQPDTKGNASRRVDL